MPKISGLLIVALAFSFTTAAPIAFSQGRRPGGLGRGKSTRPQTPSESKADDEAAVERFQKMSPQEREEALSKLPADRRTKLQKQLERYDKLTPAQREQLNRFNHLPPDRQNAFRKAFQKYQKAPAQRQQVMREELTRLMSMSEADRAARFGSPEFKSRYSKSEQQMLSDMAVALPPG